ncbi:MAG: trigger factor [Chloroherpetonaceae bacterium]|nr:trigger factor [Chloroherpetonaceae bacterium]
MTHDIKVLSATEQEMTLTFEHDDYQTELNNRYKEAQSAVQFKGFRRGKVPMDLIRKTMGKEIESDTVETITQKKFSELAESLKIKMVGRARIRHFEFKGDLTLQVFVQYEVQPDFDLKPYEDYEFIRPKYTVTDSSVQNEIKSLLREHAVWVNEDKPATEENMIVADAQKLDNGGMPIIGGRFENQEFNLKAMSPESPLRKSLLGVIPNDERVVDLELADKNGAKELAKIRVTIKEVKRQDFPELTDDLAKEITNGQFESADALKTDIHKQLEQFYEAQAEEALREDIAQKFVKENTVELPQSLVASFSDSFVENAKYRLGGKFPPNFNIDAFRRETRPSAEMQAKWMLIRTKIIETAGIKLEEADIQALAAEDAKKYGIDTEAMMKNYQSEEMLNVVIDRIMRTKVYDHLKSKMKIKEEVREFKPEDAVEA